MYQKVMENCSVSKRGVDSGAVWHCETYSLRPYTTLDSGQKYASTIELTAMKQNLTIEYRCGMYTVTIWVTITAVRPDPIHTRIPV